MDNNKPWLENKKWQSKQIASGAKKGHLILWGFALFWNLLTLPLLLDHAEIREKMLNDPVVMAVLLFPLTGVALLIAAARATHQWRKFGPTPLLLDPFPGSTGGHVGGSIDTNIPFSSTQSCAVTLSCVYSYMSGSGKSRSRHENIKWQSSGICHFEPLAKGSRFTFRFTTPDQLPVSDVKKGSSYHLWRVAVETELEGVDYSRQFEIPVFATAEQSRGIARGTEEHYATLEKATSGLESVADIKQVAGGVEAFFPAFQRPGQGIMMSLFGLVFAGIGIGLSFSAAPWFFALIFTGVGGVITLFGVFYLVKSLLITVTPQEISCKRFLFGLPFSTRRMSVEDFLSIDIVQAATMQSGNKTRVFYKLLARSDKDRFAVAERLASRAEAELIKDCFMVYLPQKNA